MAASILIVEDERDLLSAMQHALGREGFCVVTAETGAAALEVALAEPPPDLVLLDLTLPDVSGIEVCKRLREHPRTRELPIVMASARVEEIDRVVGFEVGADDYITKPFSLRELVLRIRAVLRRSETRTRTRLVCGRIAVDTEGFCAWLDGHELQLTALELRLLVALVRHAGRALTRDALLAEVWGSDTSVTTRSVDTLVLHLRDKLGPAAAQLQTLRSVGYRLTPDAPDAT
ncbi:MAG: response regulator transcription factor [Myxococcales bacterium]|nr:response regulator transcription factor [Myxococcales bacterium]